MQYCLIIRVAGLERLRQVMGELATEMALRRLADQLPERIRTVLDHHSIIPRNSTVEFEQGSCRSCFEYRPTGDLLTDPEFLQQIVLAAETHVLAAAVAVFGYATARVADVQVALLDSAQAEHEAAIEQAFVERYQQACDQVVSAGQQLQQLLDGAGPRIFLQPIVDIRQPDCPVIGYEALARGPHGSDIERADQLFETARQCGLGEELEKSCIRAALQWQKRLPEQMILSINASAAVLLEVGVQRQLARESIWVELTEHLPVGQTGLLKPVLDRLSQQGACIALDDAGCGYADLQAAEALRPAVVKLCITIIRALEQSEEVIRELKQTVQQLKALGCLVLAEGVETAEQLAQVQQFEIDYVQGWYFGRPEAAETLLGLAD